MTADFLQEVITKLQKWNKKWLLQFNEEKCKAMYLERGNPAHQYHMGNTPLSTTEAEKDLGLYVTRLPVRGYPAYQYNTGNTPLSTAEAEKDLGLYVTRLQLKAKSMPIVADRLIMNETPLLPFVFSYSG